MKPFRLLVAAALMMAVGNAAALAEPVTEAVAKANLAKVPAKDPAPTAVTSLLPAMQGQHPRLLFTKAEIEKLKPLLASDPILKQTYADVATWAKRFNLAKAWQPTAIFRDDTPAITMVKSWPGLIYVYAVEHDPVVKQGIIDILQMMLREPYWANTAELDSNMGAAQNMLMVGLLFDAIRDDLEPEFRAQMAAKILVHARRMYYLGHKKLCLMPVKYWQNDPAANHRWHRAAGLTAALLSIADEPGLDTAYMLGQMKSELDFLVQWLPHDGDCHEGAMYHVFGFFYLAIAAQMSDRVLGTHYLEQPGFRNTWAQHMYYWAPGRMGNISFGDDMNGEAPFDNQEAAFFLSPKLSRDANVQAALLRQFKAKAKHPTIPTRGFAYPWALLAFYDPTVGSGDYKALPTNRLFPDLGAVSLRDTWEDNAFCFTFKCGPYGGHTLNAYAHANKDAKGDPCYINVAHDDPDANSFALGTAGEFLFHPGLYSFHKITASQSTLTVDDKGQINEGNDYTQPVPHVDMRKLSYLTGWKTRGDRVIVEGETAAAYPDKVLEQFRRTVVWMPGEYILLLDNVQASGAHRMTWRGTVEKGQFENPETGRCYVSTKGGKRLDFQILANRPFNGAIDHAFLDGRFGSSLMQQFQFSLDGEAVKFACLMDPWKKKAELTLQEKGTAVTLTVRGEGFVDTWTWQNPVNATTPSVVAGTRNGVELIRMGTDDKAPTETSDRHATARN